MSSQTNTSYLKKMDSYVDENGQLTLRSQDIYVIRKEGTHATLIDYEDYTGPKAIKLEWCYDETDHHFFFQTANGLRPANLTSPALTKVIPWNLSTARCPTGIDKTDLKPGYLLDLRALQMSRLNAPSRTETKTDVILDQPIGKLEPDDFTPRQDDRNIPATSLKELSEAVEDNLYIVSYKNPLSVRDDNLFYPYHIHYLSKEALDQLKQYDLEHGQDRDLNELKHTIVELKLHLHDVKQDEQAAQIQKIIEENDTLTSQSLSRYYKNAGVQVGALNPKDLNVDTHSVGAVCMVANLQSFLK